MFVSLAPSLGVCLPDTCPAWPTFLLMSSVSVWTCEGHLPILLCESLPVLCLCQHFRIDSHPHAPIFAPGGPLSKGGTSPSFNRQPHLHAHKSLREVTPRHTTRHDTVSHQNSMWPIAALQIRHNLICSRRANQALTALKRHMVCTAFQYDFFASLCMNLTRNLLNVWLQNDLDTRLNQNLLDHPHFQTQELQNYPLCD